MYSSHEGDGDDTSKIINLRTYVDNHVRVIEQLRVKVMRSAEASKRWKRSNRSSGTLVKNMRARSQAVLEELIRRDDAGTLLDDNAEARTAPVDHGNNSNIGAVARIPEVRKEAAPRRVTGAEATVVTREQEKQDRMDEDDRRHHRRLDMEEVGIQKPSVNDRIIASRTRAYERGDVLAVSAADRRISKRQNVRRAARHRAKARKSAIKQCRREYEYQNRTPDPPSDHEGAGRA